MEDPWDEIERKVKEMVREMKKRALWEATAQDIFSGKVKDWHVEWKLEDRPEQWPKS